MNNMVKIAFARRPNSVPVRFCVMSMLLSAVCAVGQLFLLHYALGPDRRSLLLEIAVVAMFLPPALVAYVVTRTLTGEILALQHSTEAVAAGDANRPIDVHCECEVGDVADSFRKMVARLNANILRMNALAHNDPITGLPNRAVLDHVLALAAARDLSEGDGETLFLIDIDDLKTINNSLGHAAGDELLRHIGRRIITEAFGRKIETIETCANDFGELCETCPDDVVFTRFTGDQFVIFAPGVVDYAKVEAIARAIGESMRRPFDFGGRQIPVAVSVGIARSPIDARNPSELIAYADLALSAAKKRGRNSFAFFDENLKAQSVERSELESALRRAIDAGALTLLFQPKVDARTLELAGVEALLRWTDPVRGVIPPTTFIPLAERAGLMPALGRIVFSSAVEQCRQWQERGLSIPVAINVSPAQFDDPRFAPDLLDLLARRGVDPKLIEIEITETMVMSDPTVAAERIGALREVGISISIDDFGVGFSNLSLLSKLPVNFIKIDRSLVEPIGSDRKAEAIVRATIHMAHALGLDAIAEGIETQQQASFLRLARCDKLQGFLFAHPMSARELEDWNEAHGASAVADMQAELERAVVTA